MSLISSEGEKMFDKELINQLRSFFDLNQYEVAIWIQLLSKGVSTAGELSELSSVPRSRTYDVLESLEKKGFVVIKLGKPIQYIALPPKEVINRVKKNIMLNAEEKIKALNNLDGSDLLKRISELYDKGIKTYAPSELSGAFKGRNNIYSQMESMIRNAENNVKIVTTSDGLIRKLQLLKDSIKKAYERGVKIEIKAPMIDENNELIRSLKPFVEFKTTSNVPARYCVVDDKQALLMLLNDEKIHPNYDVGIWLNSEAVSKLLKTF